MNTTLEKAYEIVNNPDAYTLDVVEVAKMCLDACATLAALHVRTYSRAELDQAFRDVWVEECERIIPELKEVFK